MTFHLDTYKPRRKPVPIFHEHIVARTPGSVIRDVTCSSLAMIFHHLSTLAPFALPWIPTRRSGHNPFAQMKNLAPHLVQHAPGSKIFSVEFAPDGERARRVVSRSNCRPTGKFPSFLRMNRMIHWESQHELNACRLLEANCSISAYREQPCVIRFRLNGEEHRHYPDFLVTTPHAKALWEIKTAADARRPEIAARTKFLSQALPSFGYQYCIVLGEDLGREPRLRNVRLLLRHGHAALSFEQREYARRLFQTITRLRWTDVVGGHYAPFTLQQACRLVLEGALYLNLDQVLDADSELIKVPSAPLFGVVHG